MRSAIILLSFWLTAWPIGASDYVYSIEQLEADLRFLADPELVGRKPQSEGHDKARHYIIARFKQIGLTPIVDNFQQRFHYPEADDANIGTNIVGAIEGKEFSHLYWVVTAHYDHLGKVGGRIMPGADDNASGVAAMLALAEHWQTHGSAYSIVFVATDAEEQGLYGSDHFISNPPVSKGAIVLNINLDMLAKGGRRDRLYVSVSREKPELRASVEQIAKAVSHSDFELKVGHKSQQLGFQASVAGRRVDWKNASDHAAFRKAGIPYLYFGVDVHPAYHTHRDNLEGIDWDFYFSAVNGIIAVTTQLNELGM